MAHASGSLCRWERARVKATRPQRWVRCCGEGFPLALPLILALGCAAPRPVAPPMPVTDPAAVFAAVRAREERIVSLRASFSAETQSDGKRRAADGVLLVRKPDRFRLRMMLPFGLTVFDYLSVGDLIWVELPLEGSKAERQPDDLAPFSRDDLGATFLRGKYAFPGTCEPVHAEAGDVVVECPPSSRAMREIHIDPRNSTITEEKSYDAGGPRLVIRYGDYRPVDDVPLPFRISLNYPGRLLSVDITIQRYEVNPELPDDLFQPVTP